MRDFPDTYTNDPVIHHHHYRNHALAYLGWTFAIEVLLVIVYFRFFH